MGHPPRRESAFELFIPWVIGWRSVDEVDDGAVAAVEEARELAEVWGGDVVIDGIEVAVIGDVQGVETEADVMGLVPALAGAEEGDAKFTIDLHVEREVSGEALAVRGAHVVLLHIDVRIGVATVDVGDGTELEFLGQREDAPSNDAVGDVVGKDAVDVRANDRLSKRDEHVGEIVQIAAGLAADVRGVDLVMGVNGEAHSAFEFAIVRRASVGKSQERLCAGRGGKGIDHEEIGGMAVDVTDAQKDVFVELAIDFGVPSEISRSGAWLARQGSTGQRIYIAYVSVGIGNGKPHGLAREVELIDDARGVVRKICREKW